MYSLPTVKQFKEIIDNCRWDWNDEKKGFDVTGKNGKSIFLPTLGYKFENEIRYGGSIGYYWSSTENSSSDADYLVFGSGNLGIGDYIKSDRYFSVRLVSNGNDPKIKGFVDLGLPSGTLWAETNVTKKYLNWHQAQDFVKELNKKEKASKSVRHSM